MKQALFNFRLFRRSDATQNLVIFTLAFGITVIVTRFFLFLTDYPTIGGDVLHIAHVLWGGLAMGAALLLAGIYAGKDLAKLVSLIGGFGWGLFVDEIGKFLTVNNDYFFRPAAALIYIFMLACVLIIGIYSRRPKIDAETLVHQIFEDFQEILKGDLDRKEKSRLMYKLRLFQRKYETSVFLPVVNKIASFSEAFEPNKKELNVIDRVQTVGIRLSERALNSRKFEIAILALYIARTLPCVPAIVILTMLIPSVTLANSYLLIILGSAISVISVVGLIGVGRILSGNVQKGLRLIIFCEFINLGVINTLTFYFAQFITGFVTLVDTIILWQLYQRFKNSDIDE